VTLPDTLRTLLLDIEGTTTPIAFVRERLFGYARDHLSQYVVRHWNESSIRDVVRQLNDESPAGTKDGIADPETLVALASELMAQDRKSRGLKMLQGLIWEDGYQAGELRGVVWDDVPVAMRRWRSLGRDIAIYSSGSELAQRRLFESTAAGDLTPLIRAFFDTRVGAKVESGSYTKIAQALGQDPASILFVSDVTAELHAARAAGLGVVLSIRPGNAPQPDAHTFPTISSLTEI